MEGWFTMTPYELLAILDGYSITIQYLNLNNYEIKHVPIRGACDSRPHVVKMYFDCGEEKFELTV